MSPPLDIVRPLTAAVLIAAALVGVACAARRVSLWRRGRSATVDWRAGLLALPRSYFVDVHHIVGRDPYAARMHIAAAGGFAGSVLMIALVHLAGVEAAAWPLLALLALTFCGALAVARRRFPRKPARLSGGPWNRLTLALLAFSTGFFALTLTPAGLAVPFALRVLALLLAAAGTAEILASLTGPMRHAFAGALNLVAHPRPERRSATRPVAALRPLALPAEGPPPDGLALGVGHAEDFSWNRLLNFDACVQCGRCEQACPAFAAGQPLNPKKLVQDLVASFDDRAAMRTYAGSPHPGVPPRLPGGGPSLVGDGGVIREETLWSCTTCRACVQECPMMVEHVDAVVDLRRFEVLEKGALPARAAEALDNLRMTDTVGGRALADRLDWAADLHLPLAAEGQPVDVLLWLGEGAYDLRGQRSLRALVRLMRQACVSFAVLGEAEADSGDIARRLGDEATFQALARRNMATLRRFVFARIVTADPHVFHCLRNEYPALGGTWTVEHHTGFLDDLVRSGRLAPRAVEGLSVTYHDPCYLGRYNGETAAPRALLAALGARLTEMEHSGMRSLCCGGGGGAPLSDVPGTRRIPDIRMDQARATGAPVLAVACPNCAVMLEGVVGPRPEVHDVAELLLAAVEGTA